MGQGAKCAAKQGKAVKPALTPLGKSALLCGEKGPASRLRIVSLAPGIPVSGRGHALEALKGAHKGGVLAIANPLGNVRHRFFRGYF